MVASTIQTIPCIYNVFRENIMARLHTYNIRVDKASARWKSPILSGGYQ